MLSPLAGCLYAYALNNRLDGHFTDGEEEYLSCLTSGENRLKRLRSMLNEPARQELDNDVQEWSIVESYQRESLFSAGLSIGLELSRLD